MELLWACRPMMTWATAKLAQRNGRRQNLPSGRESGQSGD
jgi:hypothetical protein